MFEMQESVKNNSELTKSQKLGLVIQGTTINKDLQPRLMTSSPFARYDTNQSHYAAGTIGRQVPMTSTSLRGVSAQGLQQSSESISGRRTPGRQTCCMKLGKKSRRKLTIDKENSKSGGPTVSTAHGQRSTTQKDRNFIGISMKQRI